MSLTNRALWVIERNLREELTLDAIAGACRVSTHHLAHAFVEATGVSVIQHLRRRRLSEAARSLVAGAPDILQLALDAGYGSHEAFSRAFRAQFGQSPETYRREAADSGQIPDIVEPLEFLNRQEACLTDPEFKALVEMKIVGMRARYTMDAVQGIANQWGEFMRRAHMIEHRLDAIPLGASLRVDDEGEFDYLCAVEVRKIASVPSGMKSLVIADRRYAVFLHSEHVSKLRATYAAIWNEWLPGSDVVAADAPSLERHRPRFDPSTGEGGVEIWIPLTE